ncbi:MAG: D-glycerate dehydrogenase, partial [Candidatus Thorarchaeota archaeon]
MIQKVFATRKIPQPGLDMISERFEVSVWSNRFPPNSEEIIEEAQDCEGIITLLSDTIDVQIISKLPKLKVIAQYA